MIIRKAFFLLLLSILFPFIAYAVDGRIVLSDGIYTSDDDLVVPGSIDAGYVTMGSSTSGLVITVDTNGIVLTSENWGQMIWMTGAGEVQLPNAGASDIGKYIIIGVRDASEQVEVALTDETEIIVLTDGTVPDAGDESNMSTTKSSRTTFVYMETGKWYAFGSATTDGGAPD